MKIERINENKICATITSADLINNQLKLSELAFGGDKAKSFFHNLMEKAKKDLGFNGIGTPLMIEAISNSPDCLKLFITKMDPGAASFENNNNEEESSDPINNLHFSGAEGILNLFKKLRKTKGDSLFEAKDNKDGNKETKKSVEYDNLFGDESLDAILEQAAQGCFEAFRFNTLDEVILAAKAMKNTYDGVNSLFKEAGNTSYLLILRNETDTLEDFNKFCNFLSEYATPVHCTESGEIYLREHGNEMIADNALQILSNF